MGPAPKPAEQRRRRHKPTIAAELPAEGYRGDYPPLAKSYAHGRRVAFLAGTRRWYETWAQSPMACQFTAVEWDKLARLAVLVDIFHRSPLTKGLAAEIRQGESQFGGSPLDRRRIGLRIAPAEPEQDGQLVAIEDYRRELGA
jgi:hypothetical protein